ncbi:MAG: aminoacetone oxidase family FAD-binding enzyme [Nitrospirales bacterium]|nr:aminoacetone oxidase family FAD-binding enzyme [Nitrospirales bacterium]
MPIDVDIAIVGAGAAGLAAGIFAAEKHPNCQIVLLDGAKTIGSKILVSGGGRCNVTHERVTPADFYAPRRLVKRVLQRFDAQATVRWFESLGVPLKQEATGKLFPLSNKARTVLQALIGRCEALGISLLTKHRVQDIVPAQTGFQIVHATGHLTAQRVILATGGQSLPKSGSDGHAWTITQRLGHTLTATYPALVPLLLDETFFHHNLSGASHEVTLTTRVVGKTIDRRTGSLLWTHKGVSGPVVLDSSRFWIMAHEQGQPVTLSLNVFPGQTFDDVDRWLSQATNQAGRKTVVAHLAERLPARVAKALCHHVSRTPEEQRTASSTEEPMAMLDALLLSQLRRPQRRALTHTLTDLCLPVINTHGWNHAEVTAGGIPLEEINCYSMASRNIPGLYLIGEMLDCDGRIGGFNFQWAWSTGYIAGRHAADSLTTHPL